MYDLLSLKNSPIQKQDEFIVSLFIKWKFIFKAVIVWALYGAKTSVKCEIPLLSICTILCPKNLSHNIQHNMNPEFFYSILSAATLSWFVCECRPVKMSQTRLWIAPRQPSLWNVFFALKICAYKYLYSHILPLTVF